MVCSDDVTRMSLRADDAGASQMLMTMRMLIMLNPNPPCTYYVRPRGSSTLYSRYLEG